MEAKYAKRRYWKRMLVKYRVVVSCLLAFTIVLFVLSSITSKCCPEHQTPVYPSVTSNQLGNFQVVTVASAHFYDRLENFIGSMHYWEPFQSILIYDLGLTKDQLKQVNQWDHVTIRPFAFENYPMHVRNIYNYAWKILLIEEVAREYDSVLVLDAGVEIRQPLHVIKQMLLDQGYFIATQSNTVYRKTYPTTFSFFNTTRSQEVYDRPFCSGGIQGYVPSREAYQTIRQYTIPCALNEACIAPEGSGRSNHNYDQSALSIAVYKHQLHCELDRRFFEGNMARMTLNEQEHNDVVLGLRRWKIPKPYRSYIQRKPGVDLVLPYDWDIEKEEIIETTQSFRIDVDSPLQACLRKHQNQRKPCQQYLYDASKIPSYDFGIRCEQVLRYFWVLVQKTVQCYFTYMLAVAIFLYFQLSKQWK